MSGRGLTWLDVFTDTPLTGNPLAVVHDADGLDEATMLAFARETRQSETTFVQSPSAPGATYRTRIFTMGGELPFAGHPSLGTAVAVARARGEHRAAYVQETLAGLQPIDVVLEGDVARVSMLQEPAVFGAGLDPADVLPVGGLEVADADPRLGAHVVSTGVPHLIVPVATLGALRRAAPPSFDDLAALLARHDAVVLYLAVADPPSGTARARGFFVDPGVTTEDAATGSAAGPLLALLQEELGLGSIVVTQGVEMGRPSTIECTVEGDRVRVGGGAVVVAEGHVRL